MGYTQEDMESAMSSVREGALSVENASEAFRVPKGTLEKRLKGIQPDPEVYGHLQRLSPRREAYLADWVVRRSRQRKVVTSAEFNKFVALLLREQGDTKPLGKGWVVKFLRRNTKVKYSMGKYFENLEIKEPVYSIPDTHSSYQQQNDSQLKEVKEQTIETYGTPQTSLEATNLLKTFENEIFLLIQKAKDPALNLSTEELKEEYKSRLKPMLKAVSNGFEDVICSKIELQQRYSRLLEGNSLSPELSSNDSDQDDSD